MNKLSQLAMQREAVRKQMEASQSLFEAALILENTADIERLSAHGHNLLDQYQLTTANYYREMKRSLP